MLVIFSIDGLRPRLLGCRLRGCAATAQPEESLSLFSNALRGPTFLGSSIINRIAAEIFKVIEVLPIPSIIDNLRLSRLEAMKPAGALAWSCLLRAEGVVLDGPRLSSFNAFLLLHVVQNVIK